MTSKERNNLATTIEQSRRLLACGVDPKTADMVWLNRGELKPYLTFNERCNRAIPEVGDVPAWPLSALISLLPPILTIGKEKWWLDIAPLDSGKQWGIGYYNVDTPLKIHGLTHKTDLMECAVEEIEWLLANGYSLNNTEE